MMTMQRWWLVGWGIVSSVGCAPEGGMRATTGAFDTDTDSDDGGSAEGDPSGGEEEPICGNGIAQPGEECDGEDLGDADCSGLGFDPGILSCRSDCSYDVTACGAPPLPDQPTMWLELLPAKQFHFSWDPVEGADYYRLEESTAPGEPLVQLGEDIVGESATFEMPLHLRWRASYRLSACNAAGCTPAPQVELTDSLASAVGYIKASNSDAEDYFGQSVALSGDGRTLVVGAETEDSNATGIDGDQANNSYSAAGAAYVFVQDDLGAWTQQAYIKAWNTDAGDRFGRSVTISDDGNTLAVGAFSEGGDASGSGGNDLDASGAVYVYERDMSGTWSPSTYLKASDAQSIGSFGIVVEISGDGQTLAVGATATGPTGAIYVYSRDASGWSEQVRLDAPDDVNNLFGYHIAISDDGDTLVAGTPLQDSGIPGIGGDPSDVSAESSGAAYVYQRDEVGTWSQQAYIKASNPGELDHFSEVALSGDGRTLAVGARRESSGATGIDGEQSDDSAELAGAVYLYSIDDTGTWSQRAYIKASNTNPDDNFGISVALSDDGRTLAVGAFGESGDGAGNGGNQASNSLSSSGAVYIFENDGQWSQRNYIKASNTNAHDNFGIALALSDDGTTLAVAATAESANAEFGPLDNSAMWAGAVYLY